MHPCGEPRGGVCVYGGGRDALLCGVTRQTNSHLETLFTVIGFPPTDLTEDPRYLKTLHSNKYFSLWPFLALWNIQFLNQSIHPFSL